MVGLIFVSVQIILFVIFRVVSILTIFNFLFLNPEERLKVSNPGHFSFNYTWRYSLFALKRLLIGSLLLLLLLYLVLTESLKCHFTFCKVGMQLFSLGKEPELQ